MVMSKRGNDLVRRYLWMAALSAAFGSFGLRQLMLAHRTGPLHAWIEKAGLAAASLLLAALFAFVSLQTGGA